MEFKNPDAPTVAIINHPDVRRNLMWMKSYLDGMRSFFYYTAACETRALLSENEEERELYNGLFELLTPLIKDYLSVHGHEVCVQAIQVYGGAGYTKDYPVEQYARDCKITSMGWMLLWRAVVASQKLGNGAKKKDTVFYRGQVKTADFFINTLLPLTRGRMEAIQGGCSAAIDMDNDALAGV